MPSHRQLQLRLVLWFPKVPRRPQRLQSRGLEKEMATLSVCLPRESHGQRSLAGSSGVTKSRAQLKQHSPAQRLLSASVRTGGLV